MTWTERIEQYLREGRTVSGGKGDQTAKASEVASAAFQNTLTQAFKTQFAKQQGVLDFLNGKLTASVNNPQGLSPTAKAALDTGAIEGVGGQYQNALKTEQAQTAARGGSDLPSGVEAQIQGQLSGAAAGETSSELRNNALVDEQLKQQNYWNSVNGLNGVSAQINPLGYSGEANSAGNTTAGLSQAFTASNQSQLLGALGGIVGGGLSGWASGGFKH